MTKKRSIFHHVHCHSQYSVLDGVGMIEEYGEIAVKEGMGYLCSTDHHMAASWPTLLDVCEKKGLRPVFGVEVYVNNFHDLVPKFKTLTDEQKKKVRKNNHMLLLAENEIGFQNLISLVSIGWEKGFYYKPRVSMEQIAQYSEGVVATSGCLASPVNQELLKGDKRAARKLMSEWSDIFQGRFWVEWMMIDMKEQDKNNVELLNLAHDLGLPPLLTADVHYALPTDYFTQCIQLAMKRGKSTVKDIVKLRIKKGEQLDDLSEEFGLTPKRITEIAEEILQNEMDGDDSREEVFQIDTKSLWFSTESEMDEKWHSKYSGFISEQDFNESKLQSLLLCQRCGYVKPDRSSKLPVVPDGDQKLYDLCIDAMTRYGMIKKQKYRDRFEQEYDLITMMGFSSYFLIQREIIESARKDLGSEIGPGRGSVGGCLIAYLLGITEIDPVEHGTLFERFLSFNRGGRQMIVSLH